MDNFLGVIGGMGPLATADFLRKLVEKTRTVLRASSARDLRRCRNCWPPSSI